MSNNPGPASTQSTNTTPVTSGSLVTNLASALPSALANLGFPVGASVIPCAGQSLSTGQGLVNATAEQSQANVYEYDHLGVLRVATEPLSGPAYTLWPVQIYIPSIAAGASTLPSPGHSPQLKAGKLISGASAIPVILVPGGVGSTRFEDWRMPLNALDRTACFGQLNYRLRQVLPTGSPAAFFYDGHQSNSTSPQTFFIYQFHELVAEFRGQWGASVPLIFAQMGNSGNTVTDAANMCKGGEYQRQCELTYGASTTVDVFGTATAYPFSAVAQFGTNVVTTDAGNGLIRMVGATTNDGGVQIAGLADSTTYEVKFRFDNASTSNGFLTLLCDGAFVPNPQYFPSFGIMTLQFTTTGSGSHVLQMFLGTGGGTATILVAVSLAVKTGTESIQISNSAMVVCHDLPRIDIIHYNTPGNKEYGRRLALAYQSLVMQNTSIDGTGPRLLYIVNTSPTSKAAVFDRRVQDDGANAWKDNAGLTLFRVYNNDGTTEKAVSNAVIATTNITNDTIVLTCAATANAGVVSYGNRVGPAADTYRIGVVRGLSPDPLGNVLGLPAPMFYNYQAA